jgi:TonB family protein
MRTFSQQSMNTSGGTPSERRSQPRRNLTALAYVTIGDNNGGIVSNISETGMAFTAAEPILGKFISRLVFEIPVINRTVEAQAQIVWIAESKKAAGVRFMAMPEEARTEIANWVFSRGFKGSLNNLTPSPASRVPTEAPAPRPAVPPPAGSASISPHSTSPLRQTNLPASPPPAKKHGADETADFDRMFPSEHESTTWRPVTTEIVPEEVSVEQVYRDLAPKVEPDLRQNAQSPEVAPPSQSTQPTPFPVFGFESTRPKKANRGVSVDQSDVSTSPPLRLTPLPAVFQPAIDQSFSRMLESQSTPFFTEPPASKWWLAAVAVAVCFMLGFAIQPNFLHELAGMRGARDRLFGSNSKPQSSQNKNAVSVSQSPSPAPASTAPANPQPEAAPEPPAGAMNKSAAPGAVANQHVPKAGKSGAGSEESASGAAPYRSSSTPAKNGHSSQSAPSTSELAQARPSRQLRERSQAINTDIDSEANPGQSSTSSEPPARAGAESTTATATPSAQPSSNGSTPESLAAATAGAPATISPSSVPKPTSSVPLPAATPPATAPSAHAVTPAPPPSFFPVVAPGAGNVPRLMLLPEEKVIDTAMVKIHTRQFVFVPAQPGPESSHQPEKLQIGERISKLAPAYPSAAAQKGMGGTVQLRATISKDGTVENVKALHGPELLIPAAIEAVRQWRYQPTLLDRQPIELQEDFTVEFRPLGAQARD